MEHWYTLYTKPKAEHRVAAVLEQRGHCCYLPEIEITGSSSKHVKQPLFPCYLFLKIDFHRTGISAVRWTPGLRRVVACDGQPTPLPGDVITLIRTRLGELEAAGGLPHHTFKPGDPVRITGGPFRDMLAIFDRPTSSWERVQVLLNILGRASRVMVPASDLEKTAAEIGALAFKPPRRTRGRGRRIKDAARHAS